MTLATLFLLTLQSAAPAPGPVVEQASSAPAASLSATASAKILRPAVIDFDAPMDASVRAQDARAQVHRDRAGTVWAQFQ